MLGGPTLREVRGKTGERPPLAGDFESADSEDEPVFAVSIWLTQFHCKLSHTPGPIPTGVAFFHARFNTEAPMAHRIRRGI